MFLWIYIYLKKLAFSAFGVKMYFSKNNFIGHFNDLRLKKTVKKL